MENMTFYDFTTFVIDFVAVRILFKNSFHSLLKHRKNITFMTLNGSSYRKFRYLGYCPIVDGFVMVSFLLETLHSTILLLTNKLNLCLFKPMFWSRWLLFRL